MRNLKNNKRQTKLVKKMTKKSKTRLHNERNCDQLRGDIVDKKFGREK